MNVPNGIARIAQAIFHLNICFRILRVIDVRSISHYIHATMQEAKMIRQDFWYLVKLPHHAGTEDDKPSPLYVLEPRKATGGRLTSFARVYDVHNRTGTTETRGGHRYPPRRLAQGRIGRRGHHALLRDYGVQTGRHLPRATRLRTRRQLHPLTHHSGGSFHSSQFVSAA
jgi:hypothetical protein